MIFAAIGETTPSPADYTGELFVLSGIVLTGILGWIGTIITKRFREPTRIETLWSRLDAQDTKIGTLTDRLDLSDRRNGASSRIIRDLARQWPQESIPRLNPADIEVLEADTIPPHWKVKP